MNSSRLVICALALVVASAVAWWAISREPAKQPAVQSLATPLAPNATVSAPERSARVSNAEPPVAVEEKEIEVATPARATAGPTSFERRQELEREGYEAAGESADAAIAKLAGMTGRKERAAFLRGMFARLAEGAPASGFGAVKQLDDPQERRVALGFLVEEWRGSLAVTEKEEGMEIAVTGRAGGRLRPFADVGEIRSLLGSLMARPDVAAEGAQALLEGRELAHFLGEIAARVAADDPQGALSYGAALEGKERADFLVQLAAGWSGAQGEAAWNWSQGESDPALRAALQATILENWVRNDPEAVAAHLSQVAGTEARQSLLAEIGGQWGEADTQAALSWAQSLPEVAERDHALAAIREAAPVGIGAVLTQDKEGYPVIREVVPGGAVSKSPGIPAGSQIAAVRDATGQFIDAKDRNLSDIIPLLRGAPGTAVALQVIPPGGTLADRRTIVLTREQLIFKR